MAAHHHPGDEGEEVDLGALLTFLGLPSAPSPGTLAWASDGAPRVRAFLALLRRSLRPRGGCVAAGARGAALAAMRADGSLLEGRALEEARRAVASFEAVRGRGGWVEEGWSLRWGPGSLGCCFAIASLTHGEL
jgi:hypothetical protein